MKNILLFFLFVIWNSDALAHRMLLSVTTRGNQVQVEAYYEDDTPAEGALIFFAKNEKNQFEAKTNERGVWTGKLPETGNWEILVKHFGHSAKTTYSAPSEVVTAPTNENPVPVAEKSSSDSELEALPTHPKPAYPWQRVLLGVGILVLASVLLKVGLRMTRKSSSG
ncbi:MAG: hypothetical protein R3B84_23770 [Zavarzinella sp.]